MTIRDVATWAVTIAAAGETGSVLDQALPPRLLSLMLVGCVLGLIGGIAAAITPWGRDPKWGWGAAGKAVLMGMLVGAGTSVALGGTGLNDELRWGAIVVGGGVAQKVFDQLSRANVATLLSWFVRRVPSSPSAVPSVPPPDDNGAV